MKKTKKSKKTGEKLPNVGQRGQRILEGWAWTSQHIHLPNEKKDREPAALWTPEQIDKWRSQNITNYSKNVNG
jgi:hypothetical protein